jgi:hypothetical protein
VNRDLAEEAAAMIMKLADRLEEKMARIAALEAALRKIDDTSYDYNAVKIARGALTPEQEK